MASLALGRGGMRRPRIKWLLSRTQHFALPEGKSGVIPNQPLQKGKSRPKKGGKVDEELEFVDGRAGSFSVRGGAGDGRHCSSLPDRPGGRDQHTLRAAFYRGSTDPRHHVCGIPTPVCTIRHGYLFDYWWWWEPAR